MGGKYIKSLGELSNLAPTTIEIANAPRLTEVVCHSENLKTIDLSSCTNLRTVNLKDCTGLGVGDQTTKTLEVINCGNIKYVNCQNTQLQGVHLNPKGSNIKEVWYPKSVQVVTFSNCPQLEVIGLEQGHSCKELTLTNCPSVTTFGDLEYNESVSDNTYSNGWFLSGVQKITLDNSATGIKNLEIFYPIGLMSVTVKNMPKLQSIKLGVNSPVEYTTKDNVHGTYDYIGNISKLNDVTIRATNTPKLKTLYTTGIGRKSCDTPSWGSGGVYLNTDYETYLGVSKGNYVNKAGNFRCKILDLSDTPIENLFLYIPTEVLGIKIPTTIKGIRVNRYFDYLDKYKGNSFEKYLYKETPGNLGVDSNGDATLSSNTYYVWSSPISAPYLVPNIWCNTEANKDYEPTFDEPTWNFDGLGEVEVLSTDVYPRGLASNTFYSTIGSIKNNVMNYTLKNAKIKGKQFAMSLCMFTALENVSLDYSAFTGRSLNYAFANINQSVVVKVPTNLGNVAYYEAVLLNAKNNGIAWTDTLTLLYLNNLLNATQSSGMVLKEQTDYDTEGIVINNTQNNYGVWFQNSNIKYIKEFNTPNRGNISNLLSCTSLERIGTLNLSNAVNSTGALFSNCTGLNRIDLIKLSTKRNQVMLTSGFNKINLSYPLKITGSNLFGTNLCRDSNFKSLDLSECTFNGALEYAFYGATIQEGSLVMKGICTNLHSTFEGASVPTLDITELNISECTSMREVFSRANIGNLLGLPATIPNTVTACSSMFDASNITQATPNTIPTFLGGSECTTLTQMCYNVKGGALQVPSVFSIPPKVTGDFLNLFNGDVKMPETFTLDFSNMEYLLNPAGGALNLIRSNDIKDLKVILPPYTYNKTVGTEADTTLQAFLCVSGVSALTNLRFDLSKYKGTKLGTTYFLGDKKIANLTIDNLDLNVMDMKFVHNANPVFIKDFTVAKQVNSRDVSFLARTRMVYETYLKVVEEGLAELDCANKMTHLTKTTALYLGTTSTSPTSYSGFFTDYIPVKAKTYYTLKINDILNNVAKGGSVCVYWYTDIDTPLKGGLNTFSYADWQSRYGTNGRTFNSYVNNIQGKYFRIGFNRLENTDLNGMNKYIDQDIISFKVASPTSTPKTVTFGTLTNYAGSTSLTTAQKETLTTKAIVKGWNVVFV